MKLTKNFDDYVPTLHKTYRNMEMTLNEYQDKCNRQDGSVMYPSHGEKNNESIGYCVLALSGEAGEIANKMKKVLRGDKPVDREAFKKELGGVLWYASMLAIELGYTLEEVAQGNLDTINSRLERGTLRGDGDNR